MKFFFFSFVALSTLSALGAPKPDLSGTILTDAGKPLANATVFIYTAGQRLASAPSDHPAMRIAAKAPGRVLMESLRLSRLILN